MLKLVAVVGDDFGCTSLSDHLHLPRMALASDVALEPLNVSSEGHTFRVPHIPIFVSALLLADLTVPAESL